MKKLRLNEKIGMLFLTLMIILLFGVISYPSLLLFILMCTSGIISTIFLSFWGLTKFNDNYERNK